MKTIIVAAVAAWCCAGNILAQDTTASEGMEWDEFVQRMTNEYDEEWGEDTKLLELLEQMHASPININTATPEQLTELPFITQQQADDIVNYIAKHGPMYTLGELMFIKTLMKEEREMLMLFVYPGDALHDETHNREWQKRHFFTPVKQEAVWRTDVPFYTKAGFSHYPDSVIQQSPNKVYQGDRYHHSLRYTASVGRHIKAGLQMEKDAGEKGIDYISAYAMAKDIGVVHRAIVGNYRVSFGKGLAVNTSVRFGKQMMLNNIHRIDAGISPHSSMAEDGYMTGGAATLRFGNTLVSAFVSQRNADGTMRNDSLGISTLKTDGLHRTLLERSKHGNLTVSNIGGNVHWSNRRACVSSTFITTHFHTPLAPLHSTPSTRYRQYDAQGSDFQNASIAYQIFFNKLTFSGETAISHANGLTIPSTHTTEGTQTGWATLNTLQWRINSQHTLTAIARRYGAKYVSINGKAFGENSSVQNEEGLFIGWTNRMHNGLTLTTYADIMHFPWMKYKVSNASNGIEALAQADYKLSEKTSISARYRLKAKEQDSDTPNTLKYKTRHNLKLQLRNNVTPTLTLNTTAIASLTTIDTNTDLGFALSETARWKRTSKSNLALTLTYFNTDNYDSRISIYEPSLLYAFTFSSHYYHGIRTVALATLPLISSRLFLTARFSATFYFNRSQIGSSLDLINSSQRKDLQLQLQWKL